MEKKRFNKTKKDIMKKKLLEIINKDEKIFKYLLKKKKIKKNFYIKNKLINIII